MNKENSVDNEANVLDLDISIEKGKFTCKVFDKRDGFKFDIVQFQPIYSNQASCTLYGTYNSQIVRYSRICNDILPFTDRVLKITNDFIKLGYKRERLCHIFMVIVGRHNLIEKFGDDCRNILLP